MIPYYQQTIVPKIIIFHGFSKDEQKIFSLSKARLESNRRRDAEMMEKYGMYNQKNSTVEWEYKRSKFINSGGEIVHKKGIPIEHWDAAEFEEHEKLYEEML